MAAPEIITNANDVIVTIQGNTAGGNGSVILADFEYSPQNDSQEKSGVGNRATQGVSHGNATASFSATAEGEHANMFQSLAPDSQWRAPDCHVAVIGPNTIQNIGHWWPDDRAYSGSDGEATEYSAEGPCIPIKTL